MTIQEVKLDMMQRGFVIAENIINQEPDGTIVQVVINKFDSDGLTVNATPGFHFDGYLNEDFMVETLRAMATKIDQFMIDRHSKNPNVCEHHTVQIHGGKTGCTFCMATLGEHNITKTGFNVTITNN